MTQPLTRETWWPRPLALVCILCAGGVLQAQTAGVNWLGTLDDTVNAAWGVSADGSVVVGSGYGAEGGHAFSWTSAMGMADCGVYTDFYAISGNGQVVVGDTWEETSQACRWSQEHPEGESLGTLSGGTESWANATNADGSVVVGVSNVGVGEETAAFVLGASKAEEDFTGYHAFRWTTATGMTDLGTIDGVVGESFAYGTDGNGSVVVGESATSSDSRHAFRWTTATGMRDLGTLDEAGLGYSCAYGISANGLVVVGQSDLAKSKGFHAVRWVGNTIEDLHNPTSGLYSSANAANADGSVIVGWSGFPQMGKSTLESKTALIEFEAGKQAFRWTQASGMQSVEDWVVASGGSPLTEGNYLYEANGVSADGSVVVGSGYLNGDQQPFVARGTGVLGMADMLRSLTQPTVAGTTLHERLRSGVMTDLQNNAPRQGQFAFSSMLVYEKYTKSEAEGHGAGGTVKLVCGLSDAFRVGFSYIRGGESIDLGGNGSLTNHVDIYGGLLSYGEYTGEGLRGRFSFAYGDGDSDITRNYLTGSGGDHSSGRMGVYQQGCTLEGGYGFRVNPRTLVTPSMSLEWLKTNLGGYTETGGTFPARFDARALVDNYVRAGLKGQRDFGDASAVILEGNYVYRLSSVHNPVSGNLVGLYGFSNKVDLSQSWGEVRVGLDHVPVSVSKNLHLLLRYQASFGQNYDVPAHRVEAGFSFYF